MSTKRVEDERIIFELMLEQHEALHLQGHTDNIHLITENVSGIPARISLRGKNEATKYFLIPKALRKDFSDHYHNSDVSCQKIALSDKTMFVYTVVPDKRGLSQVGESVLLKS